VLRQLNDLPCRIVETSEDQMAIVAIVREAALYGAKEAEPLCRSSDVITRLFLKQTIDGSMQILQMQREDCGYRDKQPWTKEEMRIVRQEMFSLITESRKLEREQDNASTYEGSNDGTKHLS